MKAFLKKHLHDNLHISADPSSRTSKFPEGKGRFGDRGECPYCHKFFAAKLNRHINGVHLKLRPYRCNFCDATFTQAGNRATHMGSVHGVRRDKDGHEMT